MHRCLLQPHYKKRERWLPKAYQINQISYIAKVENAYHTTRCNRNIISDIEPSTLSITGIKNNLSHSKNISAVLKIKPGYILCEGWITCTVIREYSYRLISVEGNKLSHFFLFESKSSSWLLIVDILIECWISDQPHHQLRSNEWMQSEGKRSFYFFLVFTTCNLTLVVDCCCSYPHFRLVS